MLRVKQTEIWSPHLVPLLGGTVEVYKRAKCIASLSFYPLLKDVVPRGNDFSFGNARFPVHWLMTLSLLHFPATALGCVLTSLLTK